MSDLVAAMHASTVPVLDPAGLARWGRGVPDAVGLRGRDRRRARRAAMIDAGRGWLPAAPGDEPVYCRQLDHEHLAAISTLCARMELQVGEWVHVMTMYVEQVPVAAPEPGTAGAAARQQAADAWVYARLTTAAHLAWSRWEASRSGLLVEVAARDAVRRAARATYAAELAARHPQPERLPSLAGEPIMGVPLPAEPLVIAELRRRFGRLS